LTADQQLLDEALNSVEELTAHIHNLETKNDELHRTIDEQSQLVIMAKEGKHRVQTEILKTILPELDQLAKLLFKSVDRYLVKVKQTAKRARTPNELVKINIIHTDQLLSIIRKHIQNITQLFELKQGQQNLESNSPSEDDELHGNSAKEC